VFSSFDWRYSKGPGLVSRVLTQQAPHVCGSCWAEAAMGALSDRFRIATDGALDVQLAVQTLLNFDPTLTGGDCSGGDAVMGYKFVHRFGVVDDTCATFVGESFGDNSMGEIAPDGGDAPNAATKEEKETAFVRTRMCEHHAGAIAFETTRAALISVPSSGATSVTGPATATGSTHPRSLRSTSRTRPRKASMRLGSGDGTRSTSTAL
jgi:hypothetical protein